MTGGAIRVTAVPRSKHPNAGLQAMYFATHYRDSVWALPAPGDYVGEYRDVRFFFLERGIFKKMLPMRVIRAAYLVWVLCKAAFLPRQLFFVHSFVFAVPFWVLRRRYCICVHGTDRRFLDSAWARSVARGAVAVFGVGFGVQAKDVKVQEVPNIFIPATPVKGTEPGCDVLFVLRNAAVKNPLYPLALAEALGDGLGLSITVLGVAPAELPPSGKERLQALRDRGVRIEYRGAGPYSEVVRCMSTSRVLIIPSFSEGLPKVLLEGMYQGMHVVVNRDLVLPEAIQERVVGVALDDWRAIAEIVQRQRGCERSEENKAFAQRYLAESQAVLMKSYDDIYASYGAERPTENAA
jgi:hypothetical protein